MPGDGDTASLRDDLTQAGARRRYDTMLGEGERMGGEVVGGGTVPLPFTNGVLLFF